MVTPRLTETSPAEAQIVPPPTSPLKATPSPAMMATAALSEPTVVNCTPRRALERLASGDPGGVEHLHRAGEDRGSERRPSRGSTRSRRSP